MSTKIYRWSKNLMLYDVKTCVHFRYFFLKLSRVFLLSQSFPFWLSPGLPSYVLFLSDTVILAATMPGLSRIGLMEIIKIMTYGLIAESEDISYVTWSLLISYLSAVAAAANSDGTNIQGRFYVRAGGMCPRFTCCPSDSKLSCRFKMLEIR